MTQIAHTNSPVCWTTPLGLPVVQPYRRENVFHISTAMQDVQVKVGERREFDCSDVLPVLTRRQSSAFPPNFVREWRRM